MVGLISPEKKQHSIRARGMMTVPQDASTFFQVLVTLAIKGWLRG